jgi:hypothetical protein
MRRRTAIAIGIGVGVLAVGGIAAGVVLSTGGGSSSSSTSATPGPVKISSAAASGRVVVTECPPVSGPRWSYPGRITMSSEKYESFATGVDCADAAAWTKALSGRTVADKRVGHESALAGPPGFKCGGYADRDGHAYAGVCRHGTSKIQFGWNINVLVGPAEQVVNSEDVGREALGTADASTLLRDLGGNRYRLDVVNTSEIGSIDRFKWTAPEGWKITGITKSTGGSCELAADGTIACTGSLHVPKCLCTRTGGALSVEFTAKAQTYKIVDGYRVYNSTAGGHLTVNAMTPVPYLVPSTRKAEAHHGNL